MTLWSEVVTTALLGTGRRALPDELPGWADVGATGESAEARVLDLAAAHRVAALAGRPPTKAALPVGPAAAPVQRLTVAPPAARRLLEALLVRPDGASVNLWLSTCVRHRLGLSPEHWAPLVELGYRSPTYDRGLLALALGVRGRWFVHQNPEWQRFAETLDRLAEVPSDRLRARSAGAPYEELRARTPTTEQVLADPEVLLAVPDPWPDFLVQAAYAGLAEGRMGGKSHTYARALGARLTLPQYAALGTAARDILELPQLSPAARRGMRRLFIEIERAAFDRVEVERAFDPGVERIFRVSIPAV